MAIGSGNSILAADYNAIQTIVDNVLGTGTSGYGQTVSSNQVAAGDGITASQMQNLKTDLDKISYHQTNAASTAPSVSVGGSILASDWSTYNSQATILQTNRYILSSGQATETVGVNPTFTGWNGILTHEVIVSFGYADAARYFFNSGSTIKIIPNQSGFNSSTSKGGRWAALFSTVTFNYANWAAMTGTNQQIHLATDTGTYSGNIFRILAKADAANLYLTITFEDNGLTGSIDENVDGTTRSTVSHFRATGSYVLVAAPNVVTTNSQTFPSAAIITAATAISGTSATVAFTAPTSNGGSAITSYTATSSPGGITGTLSQAGSGTITVTGLTLGTTYTFTVRATNGLGNSTTSGSSNSVTTSNTINFPSAPTITAATATGTTTATVAFTAPTSNGGSAITSYTATSSPGGITATLNQAGSGTFTMTGLTAGTAYTFTVRATNGLGNSTTSAASNSITTYSVPANSAAPVVSGTATEGLTLTTTTGTWTGIPTPTYSYQWQRNASTNIGTNSSSYLLVSADVGSNIRCVVTANNAAGNTSATSNATSAVAAAPTASGAPTIGTATATGTTTATVSYTAPASNGGATITSYTATSTPGSRTGTVSQAGNGIITVSGLTAGTEYTFTVRATNSVGQSGASSASNSITTYLLPANSATPVVSGTATEGQTLTTTTGTWTGIPTPTYTYQWKRAGVNIGTNSSSYTLVTADIGSTILCVVTAANAAGSTSANSNATSAVVAVPVYIEDVFSTSLYTGNGTTQTITNGIDLSDQGGFVWIKNRTSAHNHNLFDTNQGVTKLFHSNTTNATITDANSLTAFRTTGFTLGSGNTAGNQVNTSGDNFVSWTFRKKPDFFDVVTYTGTGENRTISHNVGNPGVVMVKRIDTVSNWQVNMYGSAALGGASLQLNSGAAQSLAPTVWNSKDIQAGYFEVGTSSDTNALGGTYIAYVFDSQSSKHGLTSSEIIIRCFVFVTDGSGNAPEVNLGWEPQFVLIKETASDSSYGWIILDTMRGFSTDASDNYLAPHNTNAETTFGAGRPTATGFIPPPLYPTSIYAYIAIRRPMKVPTTGTSVFGLSARTGTGANATVTGGAGVSDLAIIKNRGSTPVWAWASRLTNTGYLSSNAITAEIAAGATILQANPWDVMDGVKVGTTSTITNASGNTFINYLFKRARGFFDEVCYTGTGSTNIVNHNLGVAPEFVIAKSRSGTSDWDCNFPALGRYATLNTADAGFAYSLPVTSTTINVSANVGNNPSVTYVAYLFATCPGVSKVGSYTGTGATQTIDCGFTGGARFVLIKRTDSTGDWYVWDTARGMVAGTNPSLLLNSTAAEVNTNSVYTTGVGFQIVSTVAGINASGGTYIYLAIA